MQKNLILVANPNGLDRRDFEEIAEAVTRENHRVNPFVVSIGQDSSVIPEEAWRHPTLTISFGDMGKFKPRRGVLLQNRAIHKYQQYVQFCLAGVNTPRTASFDRRHNYEPADWGEFCIIKPADFGKMSKGGNVRLQRTLRLASFDPAQYPAEHVYRHSSLLVQSFIDTGPCPTYWRVSTLLGEPLFCLKSLCPAERPPLDSPDEVIEAAIIEPKHPDIKKMFDYKVTRIFEADPEVLEFARQVYRAFPRIPLQGCDILRDATTGKLYVLEINAGGNTWHFSSPIYAVQRKILGGREAFTRQLDAFAVAARVLAQRTDQLAA